MNTRAVSGEVMSGGKETRMLRLKPPEVIVTVPPLVKSGQVPT